MPRTRISLAELACDHLVIVQMFATNPEAYSEVHPGANLAARPEAIRLDTDLTQP